MATQDKSQGNSTFPMFVYSDPLTVFKSLNEGASYWDSIEKPKVKRKRKFSAKKTTRRTFK